MGCLTVDVQKPAPLAAGKANLNGLAVSCYGDPAVADVTPAGGMAMEAERVGYGMETAVRTMNIWPSVGLWLVCSVGLDRDEYLMVTEGNLITIDGKYLKVLKA